MIGSVFMWAISIFPTLMLQTVMDGPRTRFIRRFLWFAIIGFTIVVDVLYRNAYESQKWVQDDPATRERTQVVDNIWPTQSKTRVSESLKHALTVGDLILALNPVWWLYNLLWAINPSGRKEAWNPRLQGFDVSWDWRTSVRIANESNNETDWQFGQVLALATWCRSG
ncbi:hypothetical protein DL769_003363 [Monosporascus sp. CRB-8-3]|nr:hypothetical protein DL769_003363 [Monosporascus sp. CRB-8-3]